MTTIEKIEHEIKRLPEQSRLIVLHFIKFLSLQPDAGDQIRDLSFWNNFSLQQAMRGYEDDRSPEYKVNDVIELYKK